MTMHCKFLGIEWTPKVLLTLFQLYEIYSVFRSKSSQGLGYSSSSLERAAWYYSNEW
jgi:hypothetical protein